MGEAVAVEILLGGHGAKVFKKVGLIIIYFCFMKLLLCLIFTCSFIYCKAQINNLVPNPSFEEYDTCPEVVSQISYAASWFQPTLGTCDYFNACCTGTPMGGGVGVPNNLKGFQNARTGNAYSGICLFAIVPEPYREYIETRLINSLIAGKTYCVQFYVSLANSSTIATDSIGVYFTTDSLVNNTIQTTITCLNQIQNPTGSYLNDTLNWMKVSGQFVANGGENFMTIGNFNNVNLLDISYYYIDDVSVYLCSDSLENKISIPNIFTPNNDNSNDEFEIKNLPKGAQVKIYNRWGALLFESNEPLNYWDGRTKSGTPVPDGIYYYLITLPQGGVKKGFVGVLR